VREDGAFHREGDDLYCEHSMSFPTLALGGSVKIATMDGNADLHIPAGTQAGARFRIRGKGMPNVSGHGRGDLHVIARVAVPKKLSKEQKQLLEELAKTLPKEEPRAVEREDDKPFFERVKDIFG
jgi:molecular chaperone DnaJ